MVINMLEEEITFNFVYSYFQAKRKQILKLKSKKELLNVLEEFKELFATAAINVQKKSSKNPWDYNASRFFDSIIVRIHKLIAKLDSTYKFDYEDLFIDFIRYLFSKGAEECAMQFIIIRTSCHCSYIYKNSYEQIKTLFKDEDYLNIYNALNKLNMMKDIPVERLKTDDALLYNLLGLYFDMMNTDPIKILSTTLLKLRVTERNYRFYRSSLVSRFNTSESNEYEDYMKTFYNDRKMNTLLFQNLKHLFNNGYLYYVSNYLSEGCSSYYENHILNANENEQNTDLMDSKTIVKLIKNLLETKEFRNISDMISYIIIYDNLDTRVRYPEIYVKSYNNNGCTLVPNVTNKDLLEIEDLIIAKIKEYIESKKYLTKNIYLYIIDLETMRSCFIKTDFLDKVMKEIKSCSNYNDTRKRKYEMEVTLSK